MTEDNRRRSIYLVYSSSTKVTNDAPHSVQMEPEKVWGQLELFSSEKPSVVIIAQPDRLGFEGIARIIVKGHARRIIDLRGMPFISFDNESRERFLNVLEKNQVEYLNIFKLRKTLGEPVRTADDAENNDFNFTKSKVETYLKPMIEAGPTVVFSDTDPAVDEVVKQLLDSLSQAETQYSTVYAEAGH